MLDFISIKRKFYLSLFFFRNVWIHLIFIPILFSGIMGISIMSRFGLTVFQFWDSRLLPILPKIFFCNPEDYQPNTNSFSLYSFTWIWTYCGIIYLMAHPLLGLITYSIGLMIFKSNLILINLEKKEKVFGGNLF